MATDIAESVLGECALYGRHAGTGAVTGQIADARRLPYEDREFPFIYSVSAIEHIGDDGDMQAMAELGRVLAPGGTAVVTVPVAPRADIVWHDTDIYGHQTRGVDGRVFFSRRYDGDTLHERLVIPSGLSLAGLRLWRERRHGWEEAYFLRTRRTKAVSTVLTKLLDPWWAKTRIEEVAVPDREAVAHGVTAMVLTKPG